MLSYADPDQPPFSLRDAQRLVRKFVQSAHFSGKYKVGFGRPHFQQRLAERRLNINDAINILLTGTAVACRYTADSGEWRYRFVGRIVSRNGSGTLVIAFRSETHLFCHTLWAGKNKRNDKE